MPRSGTRLALHTTSPVTTGDLVLLLPALAFLEGSFQQAPEPEDLQVSESVTAWSREGVPNTQKRVGSDFDVIRQRWVSFTLLFRWIA
jgi:hypothetical protein